MTNPFRSSAFGALLLSVVGLAQTCPAHVALIAPNGGEILVAGTTFTIQWQVVVAHNTNNWDLEYSINGTSGPWLPIAFDLPVGTTSYQWTVPTTLSNQVRVRVTQDNVGMNWTDMSAADLTIAAAAAYDPFGQGCAAGTVPPTLLPLAGELPVIGTTSHLRAANLAGTAHPLLLVIGLSDTTASGPTGPVALPYGLGALGLPNCTQYVSLDFTELFPTALGQVDWPLAVPNVATLSGAELFVQAVSFEPQTMASLATAALSNAVRVTVGH